MRKPIVHKACMTALACAALLLLASCGRTGMKDPDNFFGDCGNGILESGEACDDGNNVSGDGCSADCRSTETCGNGFVDTGEECDDGNLAPGDGCDEDCLEEAPPACGNGTLERGEGCDDGNALSDDACLATCVPASCGDGFIWTGVEQCDDGNIVPGDGCDEDCWLEIPPTCGNGIVDPGEECDDANASNNDACLTSCRAAYCGDGFLFSGVEECDDGNTASGDGCSATCILEVPPNCGNGVVDAGEQCDDGNRSNYDACLNNCRNARCGDGFLRAGSEQCDDGNTTPGDGCASDCTIEIPPECGDGIVNPGEQCDDGNHSNNDACLTSCRLAVCGDGFLWTSVEECDDGNLVSGDGCSAACILEVPPNCGNGIVEAGEECDDGNRNNNDACRNNCRNARCGDGVLWTGVEECDDGNTMPGDGCDAACRLEIPPECGDGVINPGEECDDGNGSNFDACLNNCERAECGDGYVWAGVEQCDDGNRVPGDGCDADCRIEIPPECGNGTIEPPEVCDDGNNRSGDGCSADCLSTEICGNRIVDWAVGEVCDDGNNVSGDGCSADCRSTEICGNGIVDAAVGEECDDGNRIPHDGCDENCRREGCIVDFSLGILPLNTTVTRDVMVEGSGDEETGCAGTGAGEETVLRFTVSVSGASLEVLIAQTGDHAFGIYNDTGAGCTDSLFDCIDPGGLPSGSRTYPGIATGTYFLVVEGFPDLAAEAWVWLTLRGANPRCGDGTRDPGEACDDGNTVSGDGCSADCLSNETCGNGYIDTVRGEQCDDGNTVSGDGCSADCRSDESCGNGTVDTAAGEVCDDGNRRSGDGCSADCLSNETCGNRYVDTAVGEECDDGNRTPGDGCDAYCRFEHGVCFVDQDLGELVEGVPVYLSIDVARTSDEWVTDCSGGIEYVLTFETTQYYDIDMQYTQSGYHTFGLYSDTQVSDICHAWSGWCFGQGPDDPGWVTFIGWPPDEYYLIIEANGEGAAGTVDLQLMALGCVSDENVGALTTTPASVSTDTSGAPALYAPGCTGMSGSERVIRFRVDDYNATVIIDYRQTGDHVFGIFFDQGGECDEYQVTCHDPLGAAVGSFTSTRMNAGDYLLIVDAHDPGGEGAVNLSLSVAP